MGGDRDTELAIGAYQPQQLAKGEKDGVQIPHSDVRTPPGSWLPFPQPTQTIPCFMNGPEHMDQLGSMEIVNGVHVCVRGPFKRMGSHLHNSTRSEPPGDVLLVVKKPSPRHSRQVQAPCRLGLEACCRCLNRRSQPGF